MRRLKRAMAHSIHIIALGGKLSPWLQVGYQSYCERLQHYYQLVTHEISTVPKVDHTIKRVEPKLMGQFTVLLDPEGIAMDSEAFAKKWQLWLQNYQHINFLIGNAQGIPEALKRHCQYRWSLSSLTFPHWLARVLVAEQLYRATCILQHHPYHK